MMSSFAISHTYIWSVVPAMRFVMRDAYLPRRTRESVENLFNGLYPLDTRPANATLTMHVKPSSIETMISPASACPKLANLTAQYSVSSAYASTLESYAELQAKIVTAYNTTGVKGFNTTQTLYDTASATYCHGLGLKGNLTAADIQTATVPGTSAYHNLFRQNVNATEAKRLAVGGWLIDIIASLENATQPLEVYSAHDASLDMFLSVVADPDLPWPPFASNVLTELWQQSNGSMVVRMFYEGMIVPAHPDLACSFSACPWETLKSFLKSYIPSDFKSECSL
jgi:hypothetical protein